MKNNSFKLQSLVLISIFATSCHKKISDNKYPLHFASEKGNVTEVKRLLSSIDVNAVNSYQETALDKAAEKGNIDVIDLLISKGADVKAKQKTGETALFAAATFGQDDAVKKLLQKGADIKQPDYLGTSPLHTAVSNSKKSTTKLLLQNQADIEQKDFFGQTALHIAAIEDQLDCLKVLLEFKPNIDSLTKEHATPLHLAAQYGSKGALETLLKNNAKVTSEDSHKKIVLHYAAMNHKSNVSQIITLLIKDYRANPNAQDDEGNTPLHIAVQNNNVVAIKSLISNKADKNIKNNLGLTALDKAHELKITTLIDSLK